MGRRTHEIPAANIADVDLERVARVHPEDAREIERIGHRLHVGEETEDEFRRLVELLARVDEQDTAEYLLRRNLTTEEDRALYARLFASSAEEHFRSAQEQFAREFGLSLREVTRADDFDVECLSSPREEAPRFEALRASCSIRFSAGPLPYVTAEAEVVDAPEHTAFDLRFAISLRFDGDAWRLIDWRDAE